MSRIDQLHKLFTTDVNHPEQSGTAKKILQAMEDLERKTKEIFGEEHSDLWVAGMMYAVVRHNKADLIPGSRLTLKNISAFYNQNEDDVQELADHIAREMDLDEEGENYAEVVFPDHNHTFEISASEEEEFFDDWMSVEIEFKSRAKIDRRRGLQIEELVRKLLLEINSDNDEEHCLTFTGFQTEERELMIRLDGYEQDIDRFCDLMEKKSLVCQDIIVLESASNLFTPNIHYATFMESYADKNLDGEVFRYMGEGPAKMDLATVEAIKAFEMHKSASIARARQILKSQPDCVEALICLAGWEENQNKRISQLEHALDMAEESLDLDEIDKNGLWWGDYRTRPYMRAMSLLAHELCATGDEEGSREILWELIEMNKNDNQSNRMILIELCVLKKKWIDVRKLLALYPEDQNISFVYALPIYLYYTQGKKSKTKKALIKAYRRNKYPLRLITGVEEYPESQPYFKPGDKNEATEVIPFLSVCLQKDKKLMQWIFDVLIDGGYWTLDGDVIEVAESSNPENARIIPFGR